MGNMTEIKEAVARLKRLQRESGRLPPPVAEGGNTPENATADKGLKITPKMRAEAQARDRGTPPSSR
jgi:hypothetical protein